MRGDAAVTFSHMSPGQRRNTTRLHKIRAADVLAHMFYSVLQALPAAAKQQRPITVYESIFTFPTVPLQILAANWCQLGAIGTSLWYDPSRTRTHNLILEIRSGFYKVSDYKKLLH